MTSSKSYLPIAAMLLSVLCVTTLQADSNFLMPADGYRADDYLTNELFETFYMIDSETAMLCAAGVDLRAVDLESGNVLQNLGQPQDGYFAAHTSGDYLSAWASFVQKSPLDDSYWVGFTTGSNVDDRIYQVTSDGTWTHRATMTGNFDLKFYGDDIFVSANPGGIYEAINQILLLDTSGNNNHTVVANVGGYSAGLGIGTDDSGDIFYATYNGNSLLRFSGEDIQNALNSGTPCELSDADNLHSLTLGAGDTEVDAAGHVVFNGNDFSGTIPGYISFWDETNPGEATNIATSIGGSWFQNLEVAGDILTPGNAIYTGVANYTTYEGGLTKITKLIPGDANGDGMVNGSDVTILASNWQGTDTTWADGDFNGDGKVDGSDVTILAGNWQASLDDTTNTTTTAVPEPSVIIMLLGMMLAAGLIRRC